MKELTLDYSYYELEPAAEVVWPDVEGRRGGFRQFGHSSSPRLPAGTKLYIHPQPAEQQPAANGSLTPVPDELFAAEFNAWWEQHGQFCRAGGGTYERSFAFEAWRHLYPQLMSLQVDAVEQKSTSCVGCEGAPVSGNSPCAVCRQKYAPDATLLVEALERIMAWPDGGNRYRQPKIKAFAAGALATYRNGGAAERE